MSAKQYIIQRGEHRTWLGEHIKNVEGYAPAETRKLPPDISNLVEGDWKYSDVLNAWIGHSLSGERNEELYERRLDGRT